MAVKLKTIKAQTRTLEPIMFGDDSLNVEFYVNVYTPQFEEESQRRRNSGVETTAGEALGLMVVPLIASWDLSDDYEVGKMEDITRSMVNIGGDMLPDQNTIITDAQLPDMQHWVVPDVNEWKFHYYDRKAGKLVESMREQIKTIDLATHTCIVKTFVPELDKAGTPVTTEQVVPISVAGLSNVPMIVMTELLRKIGEALTPGEEKKTSSEESSFTDEG